MFVLRRMLISCVLFFSAQNAFSDIIELGIVDTDVMVHCRSSAVISGLEHWSRAIERKYSPETIIGYIVDPIDGGGIVISVEGVENAKHIIPGTYNCEASNY